LLVILLRQATSLGSSSIRARLRRAVHQTLSQTDDGDAVPKSKFAKGNADWGGLKDGRQRLDDPNSRYLRK
jgi:hypothetical protein